MRTGEESGNRSRQGFSLMELLVVLSIIMTMTGITVMGMGSYRGKITERQARNLADELLLAQNAQQTRPGEFYAELRQEDHVWVAVVSRVAADGERAKAERSEYDRKELGSANSLRITDADGTALKEGSGGAFYVWRFERESGACMEGAGSVVLSGAGKSYRLTVYGPTGRAEVRTVYR